MEAVRFFYRQLLAPDFAVPSGNLEGKTAIVTGSNTGLGLETVAYFIKFGCSRIIMACRNVGKAEKAKNDLLQRFPDYRGTIEVWELDMSSFDSVKAFSKRVDSQLDRLDLAVLNAGINNAIDASPKKATRDGWEEMLQVNVIATGLLALSILPKLDNTSRLTPDPSRLVIVSSDVHYFAAFAERKEPSILAALNDLSKFNSDRYNVTKLLDVFMTREIVKLPLATKIHVNTPNPCLCQSELFRADDWSATILKRVLGLLAFTTEKGARNFAYASVGQDIPTGSFVQLGAPTPPSAFVLSEEGATIQKKVWEELKSVWLGIDPSLKSILV